MLTGLAIRDVVLIEKLDLEFTDGLSVLTGETGAGKSILLDSLGLAIGRRADARLVRHGADKAVVTASFEVPRDHEIHAILDEHEIEPEETLILRRTLSADGRSKAFINDQPVGVALLKRVGEMLVEIQGQFDQRGLMDPSLHIEILDEYGEMSRQRRDCADAFEAWRTAERKLKEAREAAERARAQEENLRFAADELDRLAPKLGEEETLAADRQFLQNAEKLSEGITAAFEALSGTGGTDETLRGAQRALDRISEMAESRLDDAIGALERASVELEEAISALNRVGSELTGDSTQLEEIEERLFTLRDTARKHGVTVDELPELRDRIATELQMIDAGEDALAALEADVAAARKAYEAAAQRLADARRACAEGLDRSVNAELPPLKLEKASFTTVFERLDDAHWGPNGMDRVAFRVATNPGMPAGPLDKIASGGELSRFLLAIKVTLAESGATPTLIFDEVDAGVGGATAAAVGDRLGRLAEGLQILVVTHSPQVAAKGVCHWRVSKGAAEGAAGDTTATTVERLDVAERDEELARMLSGSEVTDEARAAARRLMAGAT